MHKSVKTWFSVNVFGDNFLYGLVKEMGCKFWSDRSLKILWDVDAVWCILFLLPKSKGWLAHWKGVCDTFESGIKLRLIYYRFLEHATARHYVKLVSIQSSNLQIGRSQLIKEKTWLVSSCREADGSNLSAWWTNGMKRDLLLWSSADLSID